MFYEERFIDGVLCWRNRPDGEWTAFSAYELSEMLRGCRFMSSACKEVMRCNDPGNFERIFGEAA